MCVMTERRKRPVLTHAWGAVCCLICVSFCVGCFETPATPTSTPKSGSSGGKADTSNADHSATEFAPDPLLEGWPKPALTIVFSGEQHGYLEPCGCSVSQSGGISRRADLFRQIAERGWPVTALDLGGTLRRAREQSQYKFDALLTALKDMGYIGLCLGPEELKLSAEMLLAKHVIDPEHPEESLTFLGANVVFFDIPGLEGGPVDSKVVELNGVKIGVTGILGEGLIADILPQGSNSSISVRPPADVLPEVVEKLESQSPDLMVLLSHASLAETHALVSQFPDFDIVISAGGVEDPDGKPVQIGSTKIITVGHKGKYVGVLGFYPDDPDNRFRFELVNLDNRRFQDTPLMQQHMRTYQETLRDLEVATQMLPIGHPSGAEFVGAASCGECHKKAYQKWQTSKHAHAFESLKRGREGEEATWISRISDPECLACHVTGWHPQDVLRYESGFLSETQTPTLMGQQCENCHGPGSQHVAYEELWKHDREQIDLETVVSQRKAMHLTLDVARKQVCTQCHDLDNSPNFKFDAYWEKVKHPFRD